MVLDGIYLNSIWSKIVELVEKKQDWGQSLFWPKKTDDDKNYSNNIVVYVKA